MTKRLRWALPSLLAMCCATANAVAIDALDAILWLGHEHPESALVKLDQIEAADDATRHELALARALVFADNGREADVLRASSALRGAGNDRSSAAADLALSLLFFTQGRVNEALASAQASADAFAKACAIDCNARRYWLAQMLVAESSSASGQIEQAKRHAQLARELVKTEQASPRLALTEALLALLTARSGDPAEARRHQANAVAAAGPVPTPALSVRLANFDAVTLLALGDDEAALQTLTVALTLAERAELVRLAAVLQVNLADLALRQRRPADALALAQRAAPVLRLHGDRRRERVLLHNTGLAHLALGQIGRGRADLDQALELWQRAGARGALLPALREYSDALAGVGDFAGALAMSHRERDLERELLRANREVAMAELRVRYQRDEQEQAIETQRGEAELRQLQLANQSLHQRIWALVAAVAVLGSAIGAVLLRRLVHARRALSARQSDLRDQSERDPLTGLANRRHIQTLLGQQEPLMQGFQGALMVVDIDHFKLVNDQSGHAGGDEVLRAVAQRLGAAVVDRGLAARWGGEEFLIWLPQGRADTARQTAENMLNAVAATPIVLACGDRFQISVSIGFAAFPMPPHDARLNWEQAVNMVDMALYLAKSQGRNQAVGILLVNAPDPRTWLTIADDLERSERQGQVELSRIAGPLVTSPKPLTA